MNRVRTVLLAVFLVACGKENAKPVDTTGANPKVSNVVRVTQVTVGKKAGPDHRVPKADSIFSARDTVFVSVTLSGEGKPAALSTRWRVTNGQTLDSATRVIAATGADIVNEFHLSEGSGWKKGSYTIDVILNGAIVGTKTVVVQ